MNGELELGASQACPIKTQLNLLGPGSLHGPLQLCLRARDGAENELAISHYLMLTAL